MEQIKKIPEYFGSTLITALKELHTSSNGEHNDFTPIRLSVGKLHFKLPRYFGFCFGVKNAVGLAYKAVLENPGKNVFFCLVR